MLVESVFVITLAFILGSLPTAYLAGRYFGQTDIRTLGSQNVGAVNAYRQYGKAVGLSVLLVDTGKGIAAISAGILLDVPDVALYISGFAVTLGHNFTPFLRFKGGKGAATILGVSVIMLWQITLATALVGGLVFAATRRGILALTAMFVILNALTIGTFQPLGQIILCLVLSFLVIGTHIFRKHPNMMAAIRQGEWRRLFDFGSL